MRIHIQKPVSTSGSQNSSYGADVERLAFSADEKKSVLEQKKSADSGLAGPRPTASSQSAFLLTGGGL